MYIPSCERPSFSTLRLAKRSFGITSSLWIVPLPRRLDYLPRQPALPRLLCGPKRSSRRSISCRHNLTTCLPLISGDRAEYSATLWRKACCSSAFHCGSSEERLLCRRRFISLQSCLCFSCVLGGRNPCHFAAFSPGSFAAANDRRGPEYSLLESGRRVGRGHED